MTDEAKKAWGEVGERFASWGRRVADRYHDTATQAEGTPEEKERELQRAAREVVDEIGRGVAAFADTIRDDEAKRELTEAVRAMGDAITATVNEVGEGIRGGKGSKEPPPRPEADDAPGSDDPTD
jgi:hypothetical protein